MTASRFRVLPCLLLLAACAVQAQDIELYDQPNFGGIRLALATDATDLNAWGLGRRTASVVVKQGQWELCTEPGHRGSCITVGPGRYPEVPPALRGLLVSARNVARTAAVQPLPPPPPPQAMPRPRDPEPVVLYDNADFTGNWLAVAGANPRLANDRFNDRARAIEITRGRWQLCEHADYAGECVVLGPGRHVLPGRLDGRLSSLRPVWGRDHRPMATFGGVVLFEHSDFQGQELILNQAVANLASVNFNDRTSSIEVLAGQWEFCTDAEYAGRCFVLGPGRHNLDRSLNDRISSVRPR